MYWHGLVAGLVYSEDARSSLSQPPEISREIPCEIIIKLSDPSGQQIYTDSTGTVALYSFAAHEVDRVSSTKLA